MSQTIQELELQRESLKILKQKQNITSRELADLDKIIIKVEQQLKFEKRIEESEQKHLEYKEQIAKFSASDAGERLRSAGITGNAERNSINAIRKIMAGENKRTKVYESRMAALEGLESIDAQILRNIADGNEGELTRGDIISQVGQENLDNLQKRLTALGEEEDIIERIVKGQSDFSQQTKKSVGLMGFLNAAGDSLLSTIGLPIGIAAAAALVVQEFVDFGKRILSTRKELGLTLATSVKLARQQKILGFEAKLFDMTADDIATIQKEILNNLGGQTKLTTKLVREFVRLEGTLGISADNASKLVPIFDALGAAGEQGAIAQIKSLGALAQQAGVAPGQVFAEIASNAEFFAKFSRDGGDNLFRAAISFDNIAKATDSLLDFETSIEKQLEASLLIGREINVDKARQLAFTGDQAGLAEEIRRIVGSEAEFNEMNALARQSIADLLGQSVEDIARISRGQTISATGAAAGASAGGVTQSSDTESHRLLGKLVSNTNSLRD